MQYFGYHSSILGVKVSVSLLYAALEKYIWLSIIYRVQYSLKVRTSHLDTIASTGSTNFWPEAKTSDSEMIFFH